MVSRPFEWRCTESDTRLESLPCSSRPARGRSSQRCVRLRAPASVTRCRRAAPDRVGVRVTAACPRSCDERRSARRRSAGRRPRFGMSFTSLISSAATYRSSSSPIGTLGDLAPPVGRVRLDQTSVLLTIRSGLPMRPDRVVPDDCGGGMSAGLPRGAPLSAHFAILRDLFRAERRIVLDSAGCRCSSRRTRAASRPARGPMPVRVLIAAPTAAPLHTCERHRAGAVGTVAALAAPLQDRRDVLREGHLGRTGWLLCGGHRRSSATSKRPLRQRYVSDPSRAPSVRLKPDTTLMA